MTSTEVGTFSDPDEYAASMQRGTVGLTVTRRGDFNAKHSVVDLHRLWMQRYSDNLPRVVDATNITSGRTYITFRTAPGATLVQAGVELHPTSILRHGRAPEYYQRASGSVDFATMSMPFEDMASIGEEMAEVDLTPPSDAVLISPPPAAISKLQRLHAAAGDLAENAPEIIAHSDAARGLEQALIEAMVACLGHCEDRQSRAARGQHELIMRRFRRLVEENPEEPLYVPEICKAIRVPDRTLRICCQEHLGMGPNRYLQLRRMHMARRELCQAVPDATSVTEIAMRYGFWQLGRFASVYQSLFGEAPSVTLRRQST